MAWPGAKGPICDGKYRFARPVAQQRGLDQGAVAVRWRWQKAAKRPPRPRARLPRRPHRPGPDHTPAGTISSRLTTAEGIVAMSNDQGHGLMICDFLTFMVFPTKARREPCPCPHPAAADGSGAPVGATFTGLFRRHLRGTRARARDGVRLGQGRAVAIPRVAVRVKHHDQPERHQGQRHDRRKDGNQARSAHVGDPSAVRPPRRPGHCERDRAAPQAGRAPGPGAGGASVPGGVSWGGEGGGGRETAREGWTTTGRQLFDGYRRSRGKSL